MNKPYFTKYIETPIEKVGKPYTIEDGLITMQAAIIDLSPAKLFLCSRDIQVGDTFRSTRTNVDKDLVRLHLPDNYTHETHPAACYYTNDGKYIQWVPYSEGYKIIGEVSPNAIWVKEGDEFDEDEVQKWITYGGQHLKHIEGHTNHDKDSMYAKIKCPNCNTYH